MTKRKYLENFNLAEATAVCTEVNGDAIILDATIFYPQGGGQPCDTGKIYNTNGEFQVEKVRADENGVVHHFGKFVKGGFKTGGKVNLQIDVARRKLNTKLHSAGHLIDCAVEKLGLTYLKPTKGYHFPDGPNVEYEGVVENPAELLPKLQQVVDGLIAQDLPLELHDNESFRSVNFCGFNSCGCGGTHVQSSAELGNITIKKIKSKKSIAKISYNLI